MNKLEFYLHKSNKMVHFQILEQEFDEYTDGRLKGRNGIESGYFTFRIDSCVELRRNVVYLRGSDKYKDIKIKDIKFSNNKERDTYYDRILESLEKLIKKEK